MAKPRKLTTNELSLWKKVTKDVDDLEPSKLRTKTRSDNLPSLILPSVKILPSAKGSHNQKISIRKNLKSTTSNVKTVKTFEVGTLAKLLLKYDATARAVPNGKPPKPAFYAQYNLNEKPQNQPLERNIRQKLQRGRADIDARLDLHGSNRIEAQNRLMGFLKSSFSQGLKTVIVVTGKGDGPVSRHNLHSADFYQMPEHRAVLRASIGDWLNSTEASPYVIGWQPAHPKHGGGGAVYVRIRSKGKSRT